MSEKITPRVLSIAGTDPTGGAGIHADLKAIAANGGYGMAVVTALVAQNTRGVRSIHTPPTDFLRELLDAVSDDVDIDAVKIGMLGTVDVIREVRSWLSRVDVPVTVLDPVMVAKSGDRLLDADAESALIDLLPLVDLVTSNLPELAILAGESEAASWEEALRQARSVSERHGVAVLAKGGHLSGEAVPDALVEGERVTEFSGARIPTKNTHGTGCSLSSAIATRRAAGESWRRAVRQAKAWLAESIRHADDLNVGRGNGPVSHFAGLWERGGITTAPPAVEIAVEWWEGIREVRERIDAHPFITQLADGTLPDDAFRWYLTQDAIYLGEYSRALAEASKLAPTAAEHAFWAESAYGAVATERQLHESWIADAEIADAVAGPVCRAYLDHLAACGFRANYPVLIAALLPCFWIYQDVGDRLVTKSHDAHPYRDWLGTYGDEAFAESTRRAIDLVIAAATRSDETTRALMWDAFLASAEHEYAFFAAPLERA